MPILYISLISDPFGTVSVLFVNATQVQIKPARMQAAAYLPVIQRETCTIVRVVLMR